MNANQFYLDDGWTTVHFATEGKGNKWSEPNWTEQKNIQMRNTYKSNG